MVIGILNNTKKGKKVISEFLTDKYGAKCVDVDKIVNTILSEEEYSSKIKYSDWKGNTDFLLKLKYRIDEEIKKVMDSFDQNDIVVLDYSLLQDSYAVNVCDVIIKVDNFEKIEMKEDIDALKLCRKDELESIFSNSKFHLELDLNENWEQKLQEYIDFNVFNDKKVSVVVPIHNTANYLTRCVNSITNQTYRNLEILLIDDGSTDESLKVCNLLAERDSRIRVIHQNNMGLAETRNRGIDLATGEYISFIDSDDYIEITMIEKLLKRIVETDTDVCEGSFYIHFKNGEIRDVTCEQKNSKQIEGKLNLINAYSDATILIPAWDKIYKLSSIKDIRFDKTCFKEDTDYIYKLCKAGKTFSLVNEPFYHYIKRKSDSITAVKISPRLFTLRDWGWDAYNELLKEGPEYRDAAEKILYNSLVHILRYFMRDYKNNVLEENEYSDEIQIVVNELMYLLLTSKNVSKYRKLDEVLSIINELVAAKRLDKDKMPTIDLPCIGILWNSLNEELMSEAINIIKEHVVVTGCTYTDLQSQYRKFIDDIYFYNNEFEGIPVMKAGILIDRYESNTIAVLNMMVRVSSYMYQNGTKGFLFKEVAELKNFIRKYFKRKITDYAYDNIFHLTVDKDEYEYTVQVCKKYIKKFDGE